MGQPKIMVAIDPDALDALRQEIVALRREIMSVRMEAKPDWVDVTDYAKERGVTRRTVMNWIARGEIDSRREGSKTQVRVSRGG